MAITVEGLPVEIFGKLVDISETGARFRSLILLERGRTVEFDFKPVDGKPLNLRGQIATRRYPPQGGGYEYGIAFLATSSAEQNALGKAIVEMQRREASARARAHEAPAAVAGAQRRAAWRAAVAFPIRYRMQNLAVSAIGEASDISTGGLRLACTHVLGVGSTLDLRFTLPSEVLVVYPPADERMEISPFGERRIRVPDNRRPFQEMAVRSRVINELKPVAGRDAYGLAFVDIDGFLREEIARFIHATQLAKIKTR